MHDPSILHSFQLGSKLARHDALREPRPQSRVIPHDPELPDVEVFVHDHGATLDYPSHYEPGTDTYHSSVYEPPQHLPVPLRAPQTTRLPSAYEAVH
jgi:hypothetical protein